MSVPKLLLVHRHEEAYPASGSGDGPRALTPAGRTRMHAQAKKWFDELPALDHVFSSPLVRATQTAEILVSVGGFSVADLEISTHPEIAGPTHLQQLVRLTESVHAPNGAVALVGHEPILSTLLARIAVGQGGAQPPAEVRTGQGVLLGAPEDDGRRPVLASFRGGLSVPFGRDERPASGGL